MGNTCCNENNIPTQEPQPSAISNRKSNRDWTQYKDYDKSKQQINKIVQNRQRRIAEDQIALQRAQAKRQAIIAGGSSKDATFNLKKIDRQIQAIKRKIKRAQDQINRMNEV